MQNAIVAIALFLFSLTATAATFVVDSTATTVHPTGCTAAANDCSIADAAAFSNANGDASVDLINFSIPNTDADCELASGICRIYLSSALNFNTSVTIDGYTQAGATENTLPASGGGLNMQLKIEIGGYLPQEFNPAFGHGSSLKLNSSGTIRGIAFPKVLSAIEANGKAASEIHVEGCIFGARGNHNLVSEAYNLYQSGDAIVLGTNGTVGAADVVPRIFIGGNIPAARNWFVTTQHGIILKQHPIAISVLGNNFYADKDGVDRRYVGAGDTLNDDFSAIGASVRSSLQFGDSSISGANIVAAAIFMKYPVTPGSFRFQGNYFGIGTDGVTAFANGSAQLYTLPRGVQIGGINAGDGNVMSGVFSGNAAQIGKGGHVKILGNRIFGHFGALGIGRTPQSPSDISTTVRSANDPGDIDLTVDGAYRQNFPSILTWSLVGSTLNLQYLVDTAINNAPYPLTVEFFHSLDGEGDTLLGRDVYTESDFGVLKSISFTLPVGFTLPTEPVFTATATSSDLDVNTFGETSEFAFYPLTLAWDSALSDNQAVGGLHAIRVFAQSTAPFKPRGRLSMFDATTQLTLCDLQVVPTASASTSELVCNLDTTLQGPHPVTVTWTGTDSAFAHPVSGGAVILQRTFNSVADNLFKNGFE